MTAEVELLPLPEGNVAHLIAAQAAEIEALRAEVETWKTYARGKHDLWQESVRHAERLAEALRRAHQWGGLGKGWDSGVALDLIAWIESGMEGELPPLPDYLAALAQEDRNG